MPLRLSFICKSRAQQLAIHNKRTEAHSPTHSGELPLSKMLIKSYNISVCLAHFCIHVVHIL